MTDDVHLDQHLCFALHAASRAFTRAYQPLLAPLDLMDPQYLVMLTLWDHDGATVTELGDRLNLDSGTLTPLLKRLEQRGVLCPALAAKAGFDLSQPRDVKRFVALRDHLRTLTELLDNA